MSLIGRWLHAVFLPIWWADLLDWRCFWPPSEFTACLLLWSAQSRARSACPFHFERGDGSVCHRFLRKATSSLVFGFSPALSVLPRTTPFRRVHYIRLPH